MKLAVLLLYAVALVAGHDDDWRRPPRNTPTTPTPEPSTWLLAGGGIAAIAYLKRK